MSVKKLWLGILFMMLVLVLGTGCGQQEAVDYAGYHVGYSWSGESQGVTLEEADSYIETILQLDSDGTILDAKMRFFVQKDGFWVPRQSGNASVSVNYAVDPVAAVPGEDYERGTSMFTIHAVDLMSFYAVGVSDEGIAAIALVDPVTRYQFEMKLGPDFDYSTPMGDLTVGSGAAVPTVRTSGSGLLKPSDWESLADRNILEIDDMWSYVVTYRGVLQGIGDDSTAQEFLSALGVEFPGNQPQAHPVSYGYVGIGGWAGNYDAIENWLIGRNATDVLSLVDWNNPYYANNVDEDNFFGQEAVTGATRTIQNSSDGISGATVRVSRESTSYQRALVDAGILSEDDVIKGRF